MDRAELLARLSDDGAPLGTDLVRGLIEHPPVTRHDGFNIRSGVRAELVDGDRLVVDTWRMRPELYKDGTFIAIGAFDEFLGWPRDEAFASNPKVNSLALIEFTHDVFKAYDAVLDFVDPLAVGVRCRIGSKGARSLTAAPWMAPHALNTIPDERPQNTKRQQTPWLATLTSKHQRIVHIFSRVSSRTR